MARYPKMHYDQNKADEICALITDGWTIRDICALDGMPCMKVLFRWLRENESTFGKQYERAKEEQAEIMVQEILQIADDGRNDWMDKQLKNGDVARVIDHEHVQRSRLRVEARKWAASKFKPKKYGDRLIHAGDEEAPLVTKDVSETDRQAFDRFVRNYKPSQETAEDDFDYADMC